PLPPVAPAEQCDGLRVMMSRFIGRSLVTAGPRPNEAGGPTHLRTLLGDRAAELARDGVQLPGDRCCEEPERDDHAEGDDSKDDAVLGHRLTLFALRSGAEEIEPVAERHSVTSCGTAAPCDGCGEKEK